MIEQIYQLDIICNSNVETMLIFLSISFFDSSHSITLYAQKNSFFILPLITHSPHPMTPLSFSHYPLFLTHPKETLFFFCFDSIAIFSSLHRLYHRFSWSVKGRWYKWQKLWYSRVHKTPSGPFLWIPCSSNHSNNELNFYFYFMQFIWS